MRGAVWCSVEERGILRYGFCPTFTNAGAAPRPVAIGNSESQTCGCASNLHLPRKGHTNPTQISALCLPSLRRSCIVWISFAINIFTYLLMVLYLTSDFFQVSFKPEYLVKGKVNLSSFPVNWDHFQRTPPRKWKLSPQNGRKCLQITYLIRVWYPEHTKTIITQQ